jgi:Pyruvate:ferredoxin oxidoreductase and related 2-oxoacid:ferredoxin oxidoreductases, beta subunit
VVYPRTNWAVPWMHVAFGNGGSVASGIEAAIKALKRRGVIDPNRKINVVVLAGDGGTADIGFQALSGMLERGHKVIYIMYDNEGYMNTGIQRSGTTPFGASATTSPAGKKVPGNVTHKKPMAAIAAAHGIPYVATANPAYVHDMVYKFKKAMEAEGPSFLHILQSCTPGWRFEPKYAIRLLELATETGYWVNYEIEHGEFRVTLPVPRRKHVKCFLQLQGRFRHLKPEEVEHIQRVVDRDVEEINRLMGREVIGPLDPSLPCLTERR